MARFPSSQPSIRSAPRTARLSQFTIILLSALLFGVLSPAASAQQADTESPEVVISSPSSGQSLPGGTMSMINFSAMDNVGVSRQNILFSPDGVNFLPIASNIDGQTKLFIFLLPRINSTTAAFRVEAFDVAGNMGIAIVSNLSIVSDTVAPIVEILATPAKLKGNKMYGVSFRSRDDFEIISHELQISFDGQPFTSLVRGVEGDSQLVDIVVPNIKARAAIFRVIARDAAGNIGMGDSTAFKIKRSK
jgi:hypothetical protein